MKLENILIRAVYQNSNESGYLEIINSKIKSEIDTINEKEK
jgi:hypothetical protein